MMRAAVLALLCLATFTSALQIVVQRHESRKLFVELQELRKEQDELNRRWGQLLLEQGTWGTHGRVEEIARERLKMIIPRQTAVENIRL
jgi:cell division protein FtsL